MARANLSRILGARGEWAILGRGKRASGPRVDPEAALLRLVRLVEDGPLALQPPLAGQTPVRQREEVRELARRLPARQHRTIRDVELVVAGPEDERADVIVMKDVEVAGTERTRAAAAAAARRRSAAIDGEALAGAPEVGLPAAPRDGAPVVGQDAVVVL